MDGGDGKDGRDGKDGGNQKGDITDGTDDKDMAGAEGVCLIGYQVVKMLKVDTVNIFLLSSVQGSLIQSFKENQYFWVLCLMFITLLSIITSTAKPIQTIQDSAM